MPTKDEHVLYRGLIPPGSLSMHRAASLTVQAVGSGGQIHYRSVSATDPRADANGALDQSIRASNSTPHTPPPEPNTPLSKSSVHSPRSKLTRFAHTSLPNNGNSNEGTPSSAYNWPFPAKPANQDLAQRRLFAATKSTRHVSTIMDTDSAASAIPIRYNAAGDISGITPARLVIHITSPGSVDYDLLSDFFLSYRQFMSSSDLLRLIVARYKWAIKRTDDIGRLVRLRVFVTLRHWILNYFPDDFVPSLTLRTAFVKAINDFSQYGKVRTSTADRRILGELKRCWIRVIGIYWDMPGSAYSPAGFALDSDRCFDEVLHPGGSVGVRQIEPVKQQPSLTVDTTIRPEMEHDVSSPIIPHEHLNRSASSASLSSLGQESTDSASEPQTPTSSVPESRMWGAIIRGEVITDIPTDDQVMVGSIRPPSPPSPSSPSSPHSKPTTAAPGRHRFNTWKHKMFRSRIDELPASPKPARESHHWNTEDELENMGVRIDILAASVVDNHKQTHSSADAFNQSIYSTPPRNAPSTSAMRDSPGNGEYQFGLGLRPDLAPVLQASPSRTTQTTRNDTDVESMRGYMIDDDRASQPSQESDGYMAEVESSLAQDRLTSQDDLFAARDRLNFDIEDGSSALHYLQRFSPSISSSSEQSRSSSAEQSRSSSAEQSQVQATSAQPGLRRLAGRDNLKAEDFSPSRFKWTSSPSSYGSRSGRSSGVVTRFSITGPVSDRLQMLRAVLPHSSKSASEKSANVCINGISNDMAQELLKLAEIPDDAIPSDDDAARQIALQKLEGTYTVSPSRPAPAESRESGSPRRARGSERNAWFVDGLREASGPDQSLESLSLSSRVDNDESSEAPRPRSSVGDASSSMSLNIHLPFVLQYRASDLAEQFTIIDRDALAEVDWKELIELRWKDNITAVEDWLAFISGRDVHGVELIIARFNLMTSWVTSEIVLTRGLQERVRAIVKLIHVAAHCRTLQNYSTVMQITLALASARVQGLKTTWEHVSQDDIIQFRKLEDLASPLKNFRNLRSEMESADITKGCVPFIGLYLSDLTFNAQRPAFIEKAKLPARDSLGIDDPAEDGELDDVFSPRARQHGSLHLSHLINLGRYRTSASIVKNVLNLVNSSRAYESRLRVNSELLSRCLYISCLEDEEIDECLRLLESP